MIIDWRPMKARYRRRPKIRWKDQIWELKPGEKRSTKPPLKPSTIFIYGVIKIKGMVNNLFHVI